MNAHAGAWEYNRTTIDYVDAILKFKVSISVTIYGYITVPLTSRLLLVSNGKCISKYVVPTKIYNGFIVNLINYLIYTLVGTIYS